MNIVSRILNSRNPIRAIARFTVRTLDLGNFPFRLNIGAVERPHYAYIVYQAARLASQLGLPRISVLEFGVAGGAGLLCLEKHAEEVEKVFPDVKIDIYGFDTGAGLPPPVDYRDLPYHWQEGFFAMNSTVLLPRLRRSKLIFGDVRETSAKFLTDYNPAPIAAVAHDLDYYSSTAPTLDLFLADAAFVLPRVFCYFDDTIGGDIELYCEFTGQRLAIREFNARNDSVKIATPYYLRVADHGETWRHQIWVTHIFNHPLYDKFVSDQNQQLPLDR